MIRRMMAASLGHAVSPSVQNWRMGLNMSMNSMSGDTIPNWNNLKSGINNNRQYANLIDMTGVNRNITMTIRTAFLNESTWYSSGSEPSNYPDKRVYLAGWWGNVNSNINTDNLRFSGLDNSKFYSFRIVTTDSQDNISKFKIGTQEVTKNALEIVNTDNWDDPAYASFDYIQPTSGNIDMYLGWVQNGDKSHLNIVSISIAEYNSKPIEWKLTPKELGSTASPFGYYAYSPENSGSKTFPLLVMLHGDGERGNGTNQLNRLLTHGPVKMVNDGTWSPPQPMIIGSPQSETNGYNIPNVRSYIEYMMANYPVDPNRVYITGISMGGGDALNYIGTYKNDPIVKAIVPMSCYNWDNLPVLADMVAANVPIWTFTNNGDPTTEFSSVQSMVNSANAIRTGAMTLTVFNASDHTSAWAKVYTGSGIGQAESAYAPFNQSIYTWMLQYT